MATVFATFFSAPDVLLTTPVTLPTVEVRRADTGAIVASGDMVNLTNGTYAFTFVAADGLEHSVLADGDPLAAGQTQIGGRFVSGSVSGVTDARIETDIPLILADTAAMQPLVDVATSTRAAPGDAMDLVANAVDAAAIATAAIDNDAFANDAIDDRVLATDTDTYQAKITLADDNANARDRYSVQFFRNSQPVFAGFTGTPTIRVFQDNAAGTALFGSTPLTAVGAEGKFFHDQGPGSRIVSGTSYSVRVDAVIDTIAMAWVQPVSRDSS